MADDPTKLLWPRFAASASAVSASRVPTARQYSLNVGAQRAWRPSPAKPNPAGMPVPVAVAVAAAVMGGPGGRGAAGHLMAPATPMAATPAVTYNGHLALATPTHGVDSGFDDSGIAYWSDESFVVTAAGEEIDVLAPLYAWDPSEDACYAGEAAHCFGSEAADDDSDFQRETGGSR